MKQYKIYQHKSGEMEAVKQGWSWPAFFFSFFWAMVKKMWGLGVGVLVGVCVMGFVGGAVEAGPVGELVMNIVTFGISVAFGMHGNTLRERNLASRGFEHAGTVDAGSPKNALALYTQRGSAAH